MTILEGNKTNFLCIGFTNLGNHKSIYPESQITVTLFTIIIIIITICSTRCHIFFLLFLEIGSWSIFLCSTG